MNEEKDMFSEILALEELAKNRRRPVYFFPANTAMPFYFGFPQHVITTDTAVTWLEEK